MWRPPQTCPDTHIGSDEQGELGLKGLLFRWWGPTMGSFLSCCVPACLCDAPPHLRPGAHVVCMDDNLFHVHCVVRTAPPPGRLQLLVCCTLVEQFACTCTVRYPRGLKITNRALQSIRGSVLSHNHATAALLQIGCASQSVTQGFGADRTSAVHI